MKLTAKIVLSLFVFCLMVFCIPELAQSKEFRRCNFKVVASADALSPIELSDYNFVAWARRGGFSAAKKANKSLNDRARACLKEVLFYPTGIVTSFAEAGVCNSNRNILHIRRSESGAGITGFNPNPASWAKLAQKVCQVKNNRTSGSILIRNFKIQIQKTSGTGRCPTATIVSPRNVTFVCSTLRGGRTPDEKPKNQAWKLHRPVCVKDSDCRGQNKYCRQNPGRFQCLTRPARVANLGEQCGGARACKPGLACKNNRCQRQSKQCRQQNDCPLGQTCVVGKCVVDTDADKDRDGVPDQVDNCVDLANVRQDDTDRDGKGDACDKDIDGDRVDNQYDNCRYLTNPKQIDTDRDGKGDYCDLDDDADGIDDIRDNCPFHANSRQKDSDGDGLGDKCDPLDSSASNDDFDGDGIPNDNDNCPYLKNAPEGRKTPFTQAHDIDRDNIGNACDHDMDGDGIPNDQDNCPSVPNPDQATGSHNKIGLVCDYFPDQDQDGVPDAVDNCRSVSNPDQDDTDKDRQGDACDGDLDGDDVGNSEDNCRFMNNPSQLDLDGDGQGNRCDLDDDNDRIDDALDNCPLNPNAGQEDTDGDGLGDSCDPQPRG